LLLISITEVSR